MPNPLWDILQGVSASLATVSGAPAPSVRYKLELFGEEAPPLLLVAPNRRRIGKQVFGGVVWYKFEVLIALITAGNRKSNAGLQAYLQLVEDLNFQLYQVKLAGVTEVFDTDLGIGEVPKLAARLAGNYDVTGWEMTYTISQNMKG